MYIATVPNRNSPPAILLREGYREDGKVKTRTLANLSKLPPQRVEAIKRALRGDFDGVLNDVAPIADRIFGVLFVLKNLADRLKITKSLGNNRMAKLALFLVLARVADQGSRLSAVRWARDHCVPEILGLDRIREKELYDALDWLAQHQDKIEKKLFRAYMRKKGAPNILVLYDVTSAYLEGDCNELGDYGFPRDKKKGKKQIIVGLLTAADGEPLSVKVFKGNTGDPQTVRNQVDALKKRFDVKDVVFVGDRGMVKTKGKESLNQEGFTYITALTKPQVRKLLKKGIIQLDLFDETVCEVQNDHVRLVLRKNSKVAYREHKRREDKLSQLQALIDKRNEFVMQSGRADPEAGVRKLTKWAQRYKIASFVSLSLDDRHIKLTVDEAAKYQAGLLDGCYVLETDVKKELMEARVVDERYRSLHLVERNFRTLKTGFLELRPVFVRLAQRTAGHAFVAMLGLKIVREAQELLARSFTPDEKGQGNCLLKDALRTLSGYSFNLWQIKGHDFLRLPQPNDRQIAIFDALGILPPRKTTYQVLADKT